jgi:Cdc6-like AAA superfamily ATPase
MRPVVRHIIRKLRATTLPDGNIPDDSDAYRKTSDTDGNLPARHKWQNRQFLPGRHGNSGHVPNLLPLDSYIATDDLSVAVNAAVTLERPLLVKGEPGTGKTVLANEIRRNVRRAADRVAHQVDHQGAAGPI